jgi:hypothetical protein
MQSAVKILFKNRKVTFEELPKSEFTEDEVKAFKGIWNSSGDYYTPADIKGVGVIGSDGGDNVYGFQKGLGDLL